MPMVRAVATQKKRAREVPRPMCDSGAVRPAGLFAGGTGVFENEQVSGQDASREAFDQRRQGQMNHGHAGVRAPVATIDVPGHDEAVSLGVLVLVLRTDISSLASKNSCRDEFSGIVSWLSHNQLRKNAIAMGNHFAAS